MSTLVTPSAKAHERVTGRWTHDIEVKSGRDRFVYYAKSIVGTPIPWLFSALVVLTFFSRAGSEIAAWICTLLTFIYIFCDRLGRTKEFRFFRVGSDFFLVGFLIVSMISASMSLTGADALATLGDARWILLFYGLAYCWELFPGLNRMFFLMMGSAATLAAYALWQHFTGVDPIRQVALMNAPTQAHPYFIPTGFYSLPEILGTVLAVVLPLPAAAYLLADRKDDWHERYIPLALILLLSLGVFWTYRPGLWLAAGLGLIVTLLQKGRSRSKQWFSLLVTLGAFFVVVLLAVYTGSPGAMLEGVEKNEVARAELQRTQINNEVTLWQQSTWVGVGHAAVRSAQYDSSTGNVYFQLLAQSGVFGVAFYLLFILTFLLTTYRIYAEIPESHYWHRVLISGGLGAQVAFHAAGLYWSTMTEAITLNLFILLISALSYVSEHYSRGLVTDDVSL
jgi:hypothetical protein